MSMRLAGIAVAAAMVLGCDVRNKSDTVMTKSCNDPVTARKYEEDLQRLRAAPDDYTRFSWLNLAAISSMDVCKYDEASTFADEMTRLLPRFRYHGNYWDTVHDLHTIIGRLALRRGDVERAKAELLEAAKIPPVTRHRFYGPNIMLAKELLELGEAETVVNYLEQCKYFFIFDNRGVLDLWLETISRGKTPDWTSRMFALESG